MIDINSIIETIYTIMNYISLFCIFTFYKINQYLLLNLPKVNNSLLIPTPPQAAGA